MLLFHMLIPHFALFFNQNLLFNTNCNIPLYMFANCNARDEKELNLQAPKKGLNCTDCLLNFGRVLNYKADLQSNHVLGGIATFYDVSLAMSKNILESFFLLLLSCALFFRIVSLVFLN